MLFIPVRFAVLSYARISLDKLMPERWRSIKWNLNVDIARSMTKAKRVIFFELRKKYRVFVMKEVKFRSPLNIFNLSPPSDYAFFVQRTLLARPSDRAANHAR